MLSAGTSRGHQSGEACNCLLPVISNTWERLRVNGRLDFKVLLITVEGVRKVTWWWLRQRILEQFWLAEELIRQ
jgi:hypothetical protein